MPGVPELLVILAIVFLVFGASRLPNIARSLGKAKSEFQEGIKEGGDEKPASPPQQSTTSAEADKTSDGAQS